MNPLIRQWMSDMVTQQLTMLRQNITVTKDDIQSYIIRRKEQAQEDPTVSSEDNEDFMSADEGEKSSNIV